MVILVNPISKQNIVDRFADYVETHQNSQIVWGTDALPFGNASASVYGGPISGRPLGITGASIPGVEIVSSNLIDTLEGECFEYTAIRKQQARLLMTTSGTGEANPRIDFDQTNVAYLTSSERVALDGINASDVEEGDIISATGMETYLADLQRELNEKRDDVVAYDVSICHSSCHSNCHGSRGRR